MAQISGWAYVIIGFIVAIPSFILDQQRDEHKMFLFFLVGILMIIIGVIKVTGKKKKKIVRQQPVRPRVVFCRYCGQAVYETQQYCHRCRSRLR